MAKEVIRIPQLRIFKAFCTRAPCSGHAQLLHGYGISPPKRLGTFIYMDIKHAFPNLRRKKYSQIKVV